MTVLMDEDDVVPTDISPVYFRATDVFFLD